MENKLKKAFQEGLGIASNVPFETLEYGKSSGWDSIAHMKLVAAIEAEFDIMMDVDDVIAMSSYTIAKEIVKKYETNLA